MGCLRIGGKVIGATDGPSQSYPACYRSANARKRLGCDAEPTNAVEAKKRELGLDSEAETNLRIFLEDSGMSRDLIETACKIAFGNAAESSETAMDAMLPHNRRLARNNGRLDPKAKAAFDERFGTGRIEHSPYDGSWADTPGYSRALPGTASERFAATFPHSGRLK